MYRISVLIVFGVIACVCSYAQPPGYSAIKDPEAFRTQFTVESSRVLSINSDFRQEKELTALAEKITSTGKFWFKRSNKVRIDYEKPFLYKLVMNGDKILIKDEQQESRINVKSNKLFQQVNRIMMDCIQGTILRSKEFSTVLFENDKYYLLEMTPAVKTLKEFFTTIHLYVDKKDYSVSHIHMNEPGGDKTVLTFTNKVLNQPVKDEIFSL